MHRLTLACLALALLLAASPCPARTLTDMAGRRVELPDRVERVVCSGPGCLRLLCYLQRQGMAVAVDSLESRGTVLETRPYGLANPGFRDLPVFGEHRGRDNPELLVALDPAPQVVLKVDFGGGTDPDLLTAKTGIPVVVLYYGDLGAKRAELDRALRLMAEVVHAQDRAEAVLALLDGWAADLAARTAGLAEAEQPRCYLGGLAMRGMHGFASTEPAYAPIRLGGGRNVAGELNPPGMELPHADVAKEQIAAWDPAVVFLDLSTTRLGDDAGGLHELRTDPAYALLTAVGKGEVYGVLPYNSYAANWGSVFANAYFVGKTLHPQRFRDVDPAAQADAIYAALVGRPVFGLVQQGFGGRAFTRLKVR